MSKSNYANGFPNGVTLRNVPLYESFSGNVLYVSSVTGSNLGPGTFDEPYQTLAYIFTNDIVQAGDTVICKPGHAETISSASDLAFDIAGVTILGQGNGTLQPAITYDTATTTTIAVSGANVTLSNFKCIADFADIAEIFTPSAVNFKVYDCVFEDSATNKNFIEVVDTGTTNNQCDGLEFHRCSWITPDTATTSFLNIDADLDGLKVIECYFNLGVNTSDLPIIADVATGKDLTNVKILDNMCIRLNDANPLLITVDTTTANTGVIARNYVRHLDTGSELLVTAGTNIGFFDNKATAAVDASGYLLPAADS